MVMDWAVSVTLRVTVPRLRFTTAYEMSFVRFAPGAGLKRTRKAVFERNEITGPGPDDIPRVNVFPLLPDEVTLARLVHWPALGVNPFTLTYWKLDIGIGPLQALVFGILGARFQLKQPTEVGVGGGAS